MTTRRPIAMSIDENEKEEFETLTHRLKSQGNQLVGRIHLFKLNRLREHFGDQWAHLSERVHGTFRSILKAHAVGNMAFFPYDEESYLVFSFRGSIRKAQLRSEEISREILEKLLGSEAPTGLVEVYTLVHKDGDHTRFQLLDPALEAPDLHTSSGVQFIYRPLMSVHDKAISAYQCLPVRAMGVVGFSASYDVLSTPNNPKDIAELDGLALEHSSTEYDRLVSTQAHSRIILPVHFATLTHSAQGKAYVEKCRTLFTPKANAMSFELFGLPERLTEYNFGSLVWQLRSAAKHICARVLIDHPDFVDLRVSGVQGVSIDLYDDFRSEHQLFELLNRFCDLAHQEGLLTYVTGIRTVSLNTAAICAGADFVGGYPVSDISRTVKDTNKFDLHRQYLAGMSADAHPRHPND